jgi:hypothetical protein
VKYQSVAYDFQNGGGRGPPIYQEKGRHGDNLGRPRSDNCTAHIARPRNPDKPPSALSRLLGAHGVQTHRVEQLNADRRAIIVQHGDRRIVVTFAGDSAGRRPTTALKKLARAIGEVGVAP